MSLEEIRKYLKHGDLTYIAGLTGYSRSLVQKVLDPNPTEQNKRTNDRIMNIAIRVAEDRKKDRERVLKALAEL